MQRYENFCIYKCFSKEKLTQFFKFSRDVTRRFHFAFSRRPKKQHIWRVFFSYKEKKLPWNTRFLRVPWQFRTTRGQSPCFLPEDEQTTTMLIAEIRQSPSRCHAEELYDNGTTHLVEDAPNWARFLLGFAFSDLRFSPCTSNHVTMRKVYDDKGDNLCNRTSYIKLSQTE